MNYERKKNKIILLGTAKNLRKFQFRMLKLDGVRVCSK